MNLLDAERSAPICPYDALGVSNRSFVVIPQVVDEDRPELRLDMSRLVVALVIGRIGRAAVVRDHRGTTFRHTASAVVSLAAGQIGAAPSGGYK